MERLPIQLQLWNNFIFEKPQVVVQMLEKNGIKVSSRPTLPELIQKSVQGVLDENQGLVDDIDEVLRDDNEEGFVKNLLMPISKQ